MFLSRVAHTALLALLATGISLGCGESGSDPALYPEVRFEVRPRAGQAKFVVESLSADGGKILHTEFPDYANPSQPADFSVSGVFTFYMVNAPPPYSGRFRATEGEIEVSLFVLGDMEGIQGQLTGGVVVVPPGAPAPPPGATTSPDEVRIDVCSRIPGQPACTTTADPPGSFGVLFAGTLGDPNITRVTSGPTPSVFFLERTKDTVNGVFCSPPDTTMDIVLMVDREIRDSSSGREDVIVRQDI